MDELDVKIFRSLISNSPVSPGYFDERNSLREIARALGADDMTVRNRFEKLQESGALSSWQLVVSPAFFGYKVLEMLVDVQQESAKKDMIRKLKLVHGVIAIINYYGRSLKVVLLYNSEESRSRTFELISRITNAENVIVFRTHLPASETKSLTQTDFSIINALSVNARKSAVIIAEELGLSAKTVKNRIAKLRREKTLLTLPNLHLGDIPNSIPIALSYSYSNQGAKTSVDQLMRLHFDASYLWGGFSDPDHGFIVLSVRTMMDVQSSLDWAKVQPGVASPRVDMAIETISFPEKIKELMGIDEPNRWWLDEETTNSIKTKH